MSQSRSHFASIRRYRRAAIIFRPIRKLRMKAFLVVLLAGLLAACNSADHPGKPGATARHPAAAQAPKASSQIVNGDFEQTAGDGSIPGWDQLQHAGPKSYEMRIDPDGAYQGHGSFHMTRTHEQIYGSLVQSLDLSAYAGKTVQLSAMLKTRDVGPKGWMLYLSASQPGKTQFSPPMTGTNDWQPQSVNLTLPSDAHHITAGVFLKDAGDGWMDNVELKVID
jgi:hypothetical protein